MGVLVVENETGGLIDPAGGDQIVVRPQGDPGVTGRPGEGDALGDQAGAETVAAGGRVDQEDAQLGGLRIVTPHQEDRAGAAAVQLGYPGRLARRVPALGVVGDDPRDQGLETLVPAELPGVDLAVGHHHPAQVTRPAQSADLCLHTSRPHQVKRLFQSCQNALVDRSGASAREVELLDAAYRYVLVHGLGDLSLRPLAAAIGSSPRVLLYLFGSKDGLVRALLARARADERELLDRSPAGDLGEVAMQVWSWLAAGEHRALLILWVEAYARSLIEPDGPWAGFARESVTDWLALLTAAGSAAGDGEPSMVLAVLRGALLDLLATGDLERTTAAVRASVSSLSR